MFTQKESSYPIRSSATLLDCQAEEAMWRDYIERDTQPGPSSSSHPRWDTEYVNKEVTFDVQSKQAFRWLQLQMPSSYNNRRHQK